MENGITLRDMWMPRENNFGLCFHDMGHALLVRLSCDKRRYVLQSALICVLGYRFESLEAQIKVTNPPKNDNHGLCSHDTAHALQAGSGHDIKRHEHTNECTLQSGY